jgi:ParB family chromosome partitioning protein
MGKRSSESHKGAAEKKILLFDPADVKLVTDERHHLYDARANEEPTEEFILNVMEYGVIEPITVVKDPETGETLVEDGRKRTKGLRIANKRLKAKGLKPHRIPAIPSRSLPGRSVGRMITLNEHRTADSASNRARKAAKMIELGETEEEVALAFGVHVSTVKNMLAFVDATAAVRSAADTGKITMANAYKVAKLPPEEQRKAVSELVTQAPREPGKKRSKNAEKARAIIEKKNKGKGKKKQSDQPSGGEIAQPESGMRGQNQVENLRLELQEKDLQESGTDSRLTAGIAALSWVLGEDIDLKQLFGIG